MPEFKDIGKASKDLFKKVISKGTLPASQINFGHKNYKCPYQITLAIQLWQIGH